MGQITSISPTSILLTPVDRLTASNAAGGMTPGASHVIALGEDAGLNLQASGVILLGEDAGRNLPITASNAIVLGQNSGTGHAPAGVIVIGAGSVNGPLIANGAAADSLFIGNRVATALTNINNGGAVTLPTAPIMIGSDIARSYTATQIENFIGIGRNIVPAHSSTTSSLGQANSVMIGSNIKTARNTGSGSDGDAIMIGHRILTAMTLGTSEGAIIIGNAVLTAVNNAGHDTQGAIIVGNNITSGSADLTKLTASVVIGHDIVCTNANNPTSAGNQCVYIGSTQEINSQRNSVQIGYNNRSPGTNVTRSENNVILGYNNNMRLGVWSDGVLIGHSNTEAGIGNGMMVFGGMYAFAQANSAVISARITNGNVVLGRVATHPLNVVTNATNAVMLIDGTPGIVNPAGGGYFYVSGGVLHWVSSAGYDCTLSPVAGQLAATVTGAPYGNNAAANAATLLNAPTAGDPTKWIPINDNGVIRNIPAW